jgi:hypothetical protein
MSMTNPTVVRIINIGSIVASGIVLVLAVLGILGTWVANLVLGSVVVDLSVGVENTAQAIQRGVGRVDSGVEELRIQVQELEQDVLQIGQNLTDEGLIRTLLPAEKEERIDAAADKVATLFDALRDTFVSARQLYTSLNRLPGVNLPTPDADRTEQVMSTLDQVRTDVAELKSSIAGIRERQGAAVARVAEIGTRLETRLANLDAALSGLEDNLVAIQAGAVQLRRTLPTLMTIGAVIMTLLLAWVIYTQVVVIRLELARRRALQAAPA